MAYGALALMVYGLIVSILTQGGVEPDPGAPAGAFLGLGLYGGMVGLAAGASIGPVFGLIDGLLLGILVRVYSIRVKPRLRPGGMPMRVAWGTSVGTAMLVTVAGLWFAWSFAPSVLDLFSLLWKPGDVSWGAWFEAMASTTFLFVGGPLLVAVAAMCGFNSLMVRWYERRALRWYEHLDGSAR